MPYELKPTREKEDLFFRLDRYASARHGSIGYLRADFAKNGREFRGNYVERFHVWLG